MKLKQKTEKRTRRPGAGRKHVEDKVKMIPIYMRENRISELGGEKAIQVMVNNYLSQWSQI